MPVSERPDRTFSAPKLGKKSQKKHGKSANFVDFFVDFWGILRENKRKKWGGKMDFFLKMR
jgi:hypothetical protein